MVYNAHRRESSDDPNRYVPRQNRSFWKKQSTLVNVRLYFNEILDELNSFHFFLVFKIFQAMMDNVIPTESHSDNGNDSPVSLSEVKNMIYAASEIF